MTTDPIRITGLKDFQRSLKEAEATLPRTLRLIFNEAADVVVDAASPNVPRRTGALRASLRATSQQRSARVTLGKGKTAQFAGVIEFGDPKRGRPFVKGGRAIYPGFVRKRAEVLDVMTAGLNRLADEAGL